MGVEVVEATEVVEVVEIKTYTMEKYSIVQITGNELDPMYKGCLGIAMDYQKEKQKTLVAFYHPEKSGKNAFVKKVWFHDDDIFDTGGKLNIKPL